MCDSTPIIRKLELEHSSREVLPESALGFINFLIEDYADEWLTKAMFHYRWSYPADIDKAAQMLPRWNNTNADETFLLNQALQIAQHQISRLRYVGSNSETKDLIESSFERLVDILDKSLKINPFILGKRPSSADFALYGQLTALALFDPTPQAFVLANSPRLYAWTETMEDLSGYEPLDSDWLDLNREGEYIKGILKEIGRVYAPYLIANANAVLNQQSEFECEIDGALWKQNTFVYQAKCLRWIRDEFERLDDAAQTQVMSLATECGFSSLLIPTDQL